MISCHNCRIFRRGDHVRLPRYVNKWVYKIESVNREQKLVTLVDIAGNWRFEELELTKDPVSRSKFKVGDRVKINASQEDFGEFYKDAWEIINNKTTIIKDVFTPPFSEKVEYGCQYAFRVIQESWLSLSKEKPWRPQ